MPQEQRTITINQIKDVLKSVREIKETWRHGNYQFNSLDPIASQPAVHDINGLLQKTDSLGLTDSWEMYRHGHWAFPQNLEAGDGSRGLWKKYDKLKYYGLRDDHVTNVLSFIHRRAVAHLRSHEHPNVPKGQRITHMHGQPIEPLTVTAE